MTGQDITRELERLGVPEGMRIQEGHRAVHIVAGSWEASATIAYSSVMGSWALSSALDRPRAMEAATLLLRAYDAAKQTAAKEPDHG